MPVFTIGGLGMPSSRKPHRQQHTDMLPFILLCVASMIFATYPGVAQKGSPPAEKTNASVSTNFPQHEVFDESMLSRLKVPTGFVISVAASGLGKPRMMAFSDRGNLYVTRRDQGDVLQLIDSDNDGRFDQMHTVVSKFPGVHGITIRDSYIYLISNRELRRAKLQGDGSVAEPEILIKDLPDGGQHGNRTIAFGPDDMLYISIGSDCNDCNESNPEHATMVVVKPDGTGRRIYARGLRNTIGFDWHPQTRELWGADNGTDWRGDDIPPEELNNIRDGAHYGWPFVYGKRIPDETREEPAGTTKKQFAEKTEPSIIDFPAHAAPINLLFLGKTKNYPSDYLDDALITFHGSWNKKEPDGFKVVRVKYDNGRPAGVEDFLSGFLSSDGRSRFGRPAGLAISPAGNVYVSDDANGVIYYIKPASK
ncbi:PQQ-dependent sugar dehydrogenase [Chryseolinea sp. T2]|uniref:PQQ-dependent sugar dehydrogenase n=1 Tax=Chryseolinea sp. T2 TaxID=3129255 RepID=UPI003077F999